jgi:hypothetical protein
MRQRLNWSPEPEMGAKVEAFRHNPYSSFTPVLYGYTHQENAHQVEPMPAAETMLPEGTRHAQLWGLVTFIPFPSEPFVTPDSAMPAEGAPLVRAFLGQLPYFVTDMELSWMCYILGGGQTVLWPERIMKRQSGGERLPTGCIHGYATPQAIATMASNMHKRMLVDDTGVWHAQTQEELEALSAYVAEMKADKSKRIPGRPYDSVVVQEATSNFVPACPVPLTEFPTERPAMPKAQRASPPPYVAAPPAYGAFAQQQYGDIHSYA